MTGKDLIYSAYEISCLMDSKRVCSDLLSSLLSLISIHNSTYVSEDLYNKIKCARSAVENLENELKITLYDIEDRLDK